MCGFDCTTLDGPAIWSLLPLSFSRHLKQNRARLGLSVPRTLTPYPYPLPVPHTPYPYLLPQGLALLALSALTSMEVERPALAPGMLTVGWASCTARGVDAPGFDMVMMIACAWRHGAQ